MFKKRKINIPIRFNLFNIIVYLSGLILIITLFNLQVIQGIAYREKSNNRLVKEVMIEPVRGSILDRNGVVYAKSDLVYSLEVYKSKLTDEKLNELCINLITILEKNQEAYNSSLPIDVNQKTFRYLNNEQILDWKKKYKLPQEASAEESINLLKEKYKIESNDINDVRKVLELRDLFDNGEYSENKSLKVSEYIKRQTVLELEENSNKLPGLNIQESSKRSYAKETEAAHIVGYINRINKKEYEEKKLLGYKNDDIIGQTGIEKTFETFLKGKRGKKLIEVDVNRKYNKSRCTKRCRRWIKYNFNHRFRITKNNRTST